MSARDYPEHLNPFDDNYTGTSEASTSHSRQKYNTWSHRVATSTVAKTKPKLREKPWAALNISPDGKLVRRMSILKTAVEQFVIKKKKLFHTKSLTAADLPPRSNSVHDEFTFRIISPKIKEKIRQQAFSQSINSQTQHEAVTNSDVLISPQLNGRLSPPKLQIAESSEPEKSIPVSPESEKEIRLGARPKARKKRPPPPPPINALKIDNLVLQSNDDKAEDSLSTNSSITQDLEKDATSEEENSKIEVCETRNEKTDKNV